MIEVLSNFLQDWLINKLNGYFIILYATDHCVLAWVTEQVNDVIVSLFVFIHLIPPRRRVAP